MLSYLMLTIIFGVAKATGHFDQKYFDILGGYRVINVAYQYKDLSVNECASKCTSFARDGTCEVAGYHLNSQLCQIATDYTTAVSSDSNSVILKISEICGLPTAPENGYVEISSDRQTVNFSCTNGYVLNGTEGLHCVSGTWDGIKPACVAILADCGFPSLPTNGDHFTDVVGSTSNDSATLVCHTGYVPTIPSIRCEADGQWEQSSCVLDCGFPSLPTNGDHFTDVVGTTFIDSATLVCQTGYVPTIPSIRCEADGQWEQSFCVVDCGTTIETDHINVIAVYPSGTLGGATATVSCAPGHRSQTGSFSWNFLCDTIEKSWTTPSAPDCVWELMFRGTAKNTYNVTNAFLFGYVTDGVTSEEGCMDVYNTSCFLNYRNSKVDQWSSLNINEVFYELYDTTSTVLQVKFDGSGSTINSWFSTSTALSYPWSIPDMTATWWDLNGSTDIMYGRSFRMTAGYETGAVECADHFYTVVFSPPVAGGCSYDDLAAIEYPLFTYSNSPTGSQYDTMVFEEARAMGIWVRYN